MRCENVERRLVSIRFLHRTHQTQGHLHNRRDTGNWTQQRLPVRQRLAFPAILRSHVWHILCVRPLLACLLLYLLAGHAAPSNLDRWRDSARPYREGRLSGRVRVNKQDRRDCQGCHGHCRGYFVLQEESGAYACCYCELGIWNSQVKFIPY